MKRLALLLLIAYSAFHFSSCENIKGRTTKEAGGFNIQGKVSNADSLLVLLDRREDGEWINLDSAWVDQGEFALSGVLNQPEMLYIRFVDGEDIEYVNIFLENRDIQLAGDLEKADDMEITGSESHDLHKDFSEQYNAYYELYDSLYSLMEKEDDGPAKDSLKELITVVEDDAKAYLVEFIQSHKETHVAPYVAMRHLVYESDYNELEPLVSAISGELGTSKYLDALNEDLAKMKLLAIGNVAPDFSQADPEGAAVSLSSLKGKYVLVDFWASWCGPCRRENPNVVAMYNEFAGGDFEILGVSLDTDRDKWLKAIEDDKLTWLHVSDLKGWKNDAADLYNVKAIPSTYLLDREGNIIARNIRGDELKAKVKELLDKAS